MKEDYWDKLFLAENNFDFVVHCMVVANTKKECREYYDKACQLMKELHIKSEDRFYENTTV